jgi:dihydrofolate reductase
MARLIVSEFVSLDGVAQEPGETEQWEHAGWTGPYFDAGMGEFKARELSGVRAQLLGRVTYESFATAWPSQTGAFADQFNGMAKYVVSTTLRHASWANSHVISTNVVDEIRALKARSDGDLIVYGSLALVQTLMRYDLVDQYNLQLFPVVLGSGKKLFQGGARIGLRVRSSTSFPSGAMSLIYEPARPAA